MRRQVPLTPVLAVALAVVAVVGYLVLAKPAQDRTGELDAEIAELEGKLALVKQPRKPGEPNVEISVADVFRLAKAMPDRDDMPGIIIELNSIALSAGVGFVSIQPGQPAARETYYAFPITVTFEGNYYDLTDFLYRMRNLVTVRDGVLSASGRLYTLDAIDMHESEHGFPEIQAVLRLSAYGFGPAPAAPGTAPAGSTTETSSTTTTQTTTTQTTATTSPTPPPAAPTGNHNPQALGGGTG
jgi:Tfp pilus assembly protein PilO